MNFLKRLFGGGGSSDRVLILYVRPKMCQEILRVRIDLFNSLSLADDGDSYFVRKLASASRCPFQAEIEITFDKNRRIVQQQIANGEFVSEAEFTAQEAKRTESGGSAG